MIGSGVVVDSLWFSKISDRVNDMAGLEIHDFEAMVFDRSHEKSRTFNVYAEVINAPFDVWQWNARLKRKDVRFLSEQRA